jgi:hypothetical protein
MIGTITSVQYNVRLSQVYPRSNDSVFVKDHRVCAVYLANTDTSFKIYEYERCLNCSI